MKSTIMKTLSLALTLLVAGGAHAWAQTSELEQVKAAMQQMVKTIEEMQKKIAEL
jgi:cytochrome c556